MKDLTFWIRRGGALLTILTVLSLGMFLPSTPQAAAYSCGNSSDPASECYAAATWPGNVDGAAVNIDIVPLYSPDGLVANQMWLKDNSSYVCTAYPYCWFEGGYTYTPYQGHTYFEYVAWINPAGNPHVTFLNDISVGQTGNIFLKIVRYDANHFNISYHSPNYYSDNIPAPVDYGMSPSFIQIGMRLSGSSGATSGQAAFTNSCYIQGGTCYPQTNPGNPANGYVSNPPNGNWSPQPAPGNSSGVWITNVQKYNRAAAVSYADNWSATYPSGNCPRNGSYPNFGCFSTGNDCTNFVSQVMEAGGLPQERSGFGTSDSENWYHDTNSTSTTFGQNNSWKLASALESYAYNRPGRFLHVYDINRLSPGDFYLMDLGSGQPDHARVIVGYGHPDEAIAGGSYTLSSIGWLTDSHSNERHHVIWDDGVNLNVQKWEYTLVY